MLGASGAQAASPLQSSALWVAQAGPPEAIATKAASAGVHTLFIKGADGATPDPQLTEGLIGALRAEQITVCAWTFDYGSDPAGEANAAIAAVREGARCLIVDAEGQYDKRYGAAQLFVAALRRALGAGFPIGLAGQAETLQHPTFPYSVFLGPGALSFDLPQIYWRDLKLSVAAAFAVSIGENAIYGRPVLPVGQLYGEPSTAEVRRFLAEARSFGGGGESFFDLDAAPSALLAALASGPSAAHPRHPALPRIRAGADGDEIVWAQELLNAAGARLPVGGFFGAQTARALVRFQARRHLARSDVLDAPTWRALLRLRAREPSWASGPPQSAR